MSCIPLFTRHSTPMVSLIALAVVWLLTFSAHASPQVKLSDPRWEFLLANAPSVFGLQQPELRANEASVLRELQPLLAAQNYKAVATQLNARPLGDDSTALQLLRGQVLLQLRDYAGAKAALTAAVTTMPNAANTHRSLSLVYLMEQNYAAARKHLSRALELGSQDAEAYAQLAYVNLQSGHGFGAIAGYQQALFLKPDNRQWQRGLAYALNQSGAYSSAQQLTDDMLTTTPEDADLWLLRSQIALQQNRVNEALSSLEVAIRLGDNTPANQLLAAQLHLQHGSSERAVSLLEANLKQLQKGDTQALLVTLEQVSSWLAHEKRWQTLARLLTAVDQAPSLSAEARTAFAVPRARALMVNNKLQAAQQALATAISQNPTLGEALLLQAEVHIALNLSERAQLYYQRAQALPKFRERALLGQAQLAINRKAYAQALPLLREALLQNPNRSDLAANIRALETLVRNEEV